MPRGPLEPPQENITSLSPYRFLKPQAPVMSDMFVGLNNKTLVGCTKAAGSFCCQRWQAESPYCSLDNGGARWYGIVLRHYTQLRSFLLSLCEEVIRHHTRFNFLWITKRLKKEKSGGDASRLCRKVGWMKANKARGIVELQLVSSARLWRLWGKIHLKTHITYIAPVIYGRDGDLPACDLGIWKSKQELQKAARDGSGGLSVVMSLRGESHDITENKYWLCKH